jgi:hypothetical protein
MEEHTTELRQVRGRVGRPRVNIPCMLRPEQADRLRQLSDKVDLPCSTLIRQAIDRLLQEAEQ